jgi:type II secretory pathway pseudopilin PulG
MSDWVQAVMVLVGILAAIVLVNILAREPKKKVRRK